MKLMAIDGNSILNRAFYGVKLLSSKEVVYTNGIYGFLNTYFKLMEDEKPDAVCVCFDLKAKTFRHLQYEGYKAQRKGMPDELAQQVPILKDILDKMGVARLEKEGFEADDLLGTVSKKCETEGWDCTVVTGDKDSLQLIGDRTRVSIVSTRMGQTTTKKYDADLFREEYSGLDPLKIIDLKAIMGDKSDNIPGINGIGEKGAMELLTKYGSLQGVYQNLEEKNFTKGMFKKLSEGKDSAFMSYELATIVRDVDTGRELCDFELGEGDREGLLNILSKLELFSLIKKIDVKGEGVSKEKKTEIAVPEYIESDDLFLGDTVSIFEEDGIFAVSDGRKTAVSGSFDSVKELFKKAKKVYMHDCKAFYKKLAENGIYFDGFYDTAVAEYLLSPTDSAYPLEKRVFVRFQTELEQGGDGQIGLFENDGRDKSLAAKKAFFVFLMGQQTEKELKEQGLWELFENIEMPLIPVLAEMETNGIEIDADALKEYGDELSQKMEQIAEIIYDEAGERFNIGSPKQLGEILFGKMGLKGGKKTKTGYSTDADTLEKLKKDSPMVANVLEYRKYSKLKSTYCDGLIKTIAPDGRIHTTFNQMVTATGRLSSQDPNLQNIPIRTKDGEKIRRAFVAKEGCTLIDADYSQIELRILAHISNDERMKAAFNEGRDIHAITASQVFGVPLEEVTAEQRRRAKAVNFGIVYGISAFALSEDIGVFVSEAQSYIDGYFRAYSGVKDYMDSIRESAKEQGCVRTIFGRKRDLPELKSSNHNIRAFGERVALNMPIQGAAADIMKIAMIRVWKRLKEEGLESRLLVQVHDELLLEAPERETEQAAEILKQEMERAADLSIKLTADVHSGKNWVEAK